MRKNFLIGCIAAIASVLIGESQPASAQSSIPIPGEGNPLLRKDVVYSPNAFKVPYLGVDGAFTIDTQTITATDPRNPKRVVFKRMEYFSFYQDLEGLSPIAEDCRYIYRGAAGDPFYFPDQFKTSIWDLFELASGGEACNNFYYVILRSPHGNPIHMHMRYGNKSSSFRKLLNLSNAPENPNSLDPWWSVYCSAGISGCD